MSPEKNEQDSPPVEAPNQTPPQPVDNPDLPEEGDTEEFDEVPVPESEFTDTDEAGEEREEPNDLSDVDKEFDD